MRNHFTPIRYIIVLLVVFCSSIPLKAQQTDKKTAEANAGLKLPDHFYATKIIDNLGKARHIAVTPQGNIYVKLNKTKEGGGILYLTPKNGKVIVEKKFGNYGGTGLYLADNYLYASSDEDIFRYKLNDKNEVINPDDPEKIVEGLISRGEHESKSLVLDPKGNLYVNIGAFSNSCQESDRQQGSMGIPNCPVLDSAGGIWKFKADQKNQGYGEGVKFATGLRNVVGLDWNKKTDELFVMQHGRDQLHSIFPDMYTTEESAKLPAECMYVLKKGDNAGWPYLYYDGLKNKKILAPEYGGNGEKLASDEYIDPVADYPAHMAPDGLLFYTGTQFPDRYRNGAFIAFHGSWNRSPEPQAGYFVVFQPFKEGRPSGDWEVFADGFSGSAENTASGRAEHRPCGLAQGPDGALYVSDDVKGAIYKITFKE